MLSHECPTALGRSLAALDRTHFLQIIDYYFYKFKTQTQIPILTPGLPRSFNGKFRHQENQWFSYEMLLWLHDKPHCFVHILILFKLY